MREIKIKERFWTDDRIRKLEKALGCQDKAIGQLVRLWKMALDAKKTGHLISDKKFRMAGLSEALFECELAERTDRGIRAKGDKSFANLKAKQEAGKKSAAARRKKYGTAVPVKASNFEQKPNSSEQVFGGSSGIQGVIGQYCTAWKARYKSNPRLTKQQIGQLTRLIKEIKAEELGNLLIAYLEMNDQWFIKKRHDLVTFSQNLAAVGHYMDTGSRLTDRRTREIDKATYYDDLLKQVTKPEERDV